jgi:hypothetical protein
MARDELPADIDNCLKCSAQLPEDGGANYPFCTQKCQDEYRDPNDAPLSEQAVNDFLGSEVRDTDRLTSMLDFVQGHRNDF